MLKWHFCMVCYRSDTLSWDDFKLLLFFTVSRHVRNTIFPCFCRPSSPKIYSLTFILGTLEDQSYASFCFYLLVLFIIYFGNKLFVTLCSCTYWTELRIFCSGHYITINVFTIVCQPSRCWSAFWSIMARIQEAVP